jgi:DNA-binding response OmpR family regulator
MAGPGPSILVVEDDGSLRLLSRVNLELEGFRVREAATLAEARSALEAERPQGVFLDVRLGGELSDGLLGELREAGIPVVLVSGTDDLAAYRERADGVLGKPYLPEDLVSAARRHFVG